MRAQVKTPEVSERLQSVVSADVVTAAGIIGTFVHGDKRPILSLSADMNSPQVNEIPNMPVHDCTACAAVATCALLKMGTSSENNPIKARITAIRELTQANSNFIQQFDSAEREALIKEHMQASRQIISNESIPVLSTIPEAHTDTQAQLTQPNTAPIMKESSLSPLVHEQEAPILPVIKPIKQIKIDESPRIIQTERASIAKKKSRQIPARYVSPKTERIPKQIRNSERKQKKPSITIASVELPYKKLKNHTSIKTPVSTQKVSIQEASIPPIIISTKQIKIDESPPIIQAEGATTPQENNRKPILISNNMLISDPEKLQKSHIVTVKNPLQQSSSLGASSRSEHIPIASSTTKNLDLTITIKPRDTHIFKVEPKLTSVGTQKVSIKEKLIKSSHKSTVRSPIPELEKNIPNHMRIYTHPNNIRSIPVYSFFHEAKIPIIKIKQQNKKESVGYPRIFHSSQVNESIKGTIIFPRIPIDNQIQPIHSHRRGQLNRTTHILKHIGHTIREKVVTFSNVIKSRKQDIGTVVNSEMRPISPFPLREKKVRSEQNRKIAEKRKNWIKESQIDDIKRKTREIMPRKEKIDIRKWKSQFVCELRGNTQEIKKYLKIMIPPNRDSVFIAYKIDRQTSLTKKRKSKFHIYEIETKTLHKIKNYLQELYIALQSKQIYKLIFYEIAKSQKTNPILRVATEELSPNQNSQIVLNANLIIWYLLHILRLTDVMVFY